MYFIKGDYMKLRYLTLIMIIINMVSINPYAENIGQDEIIKVGIYEYRPYSYIGKDGEVKGYYSELLNLLQKQGNFKYEYVVCDFSDGLNQLEDGEIDIMLGLTITPDRKEKILFNKNRIAIEKYGIYTDKDIQYGDLEKFNGLRIGLVEESVSSEWLLNYFEFKNIDVEPIFDKKFHNLDDLLKEGKVDLIMADAGIDTGYNLVYGFTSDQVYIGANKNKAYIIDYLDELIGKNLQKDNNPIVELQNKYFNPVDKYEYIRYIAMSIMLIITFGMVCIFIIMPKIKLKSIKSKVRNRMNNNNYFLHYQPIYNPKNNSIVGFEALIRLKGKNGDIIPPYRFISEIEDNNMLVELSIWILNKITSDYQIINSYENINNNIYISMNVSLNEIEDEEFVDKAIDILLKSNIESKRICLEITERVKMENLERLNKSIKRLKDAGFKIAIDDFGVEYSNLDVLKKLDFDVIKLDKYFIDDVCDCNIKEEIIMFMSKIAKRNGKALIIEGVEDKSQNELIKSIYNERLYVQGYLYNKPMPIEQIKLI